MSRINGLRPMISVLAIVAIFTSSMVSMSQSNDDAASCLSVTQELTPCLSFIKGNGDGTFDDSTQKPSEACCNGVNKLISHTKTKEEMVASCECIKKNLSLIGPYDPNRIPLIPKGCGIPIQFPPIDNSTDCSKAEGLQFGSAILFQN